MEELNSDEDFEFTVTFFDVNGDHATINVLKMDGGTVGKKYEGSWQIDIDGAYGYTDVMDFRSGTPKSHFEVAMETYEYYLMDRSPE